MSVAPVRSLVSRVRLGALLVTLALLATLVVLPSGVGLPAGAATPACTSAQLVVWLNTNGDGTAGSVDYTLNFTNVSTHGCDLSGYPGVSAINSSGKQLGSAAGRTLTSTYHSIYLAPGGGANGLNSDGASASAALSLVETGNYSASTCRQLTASGLRVYAPNERASHVVPFPFYACGKSGPVYLHVGAVTHYARGAN